MFGQPGNFLVLALPVEVLALSKKTSWKTINTKLKINLVNGVKDCMKKLQLSRKFKKVVEGEMFQQNIISLSDGLGCAELSLAFFFVRSVMFSEVISNRIVELKTKTKCDGMVFSKSSSKLLFELMEVAQKYNK